MEFRFLTDAFFNDFSDCTEMEKKDNRPYAHVCLIEFDDLIFLIPIRHHISHKYAIFSDENKDKGLDLSKTVIIKEKDKYKYIDFSKTAYISPSEYMALNSKEYFVKTKLTTYIQKYKKALNHLEKLHNRNLCEKSTLQYFHKELGIK